MFTLRCRRLMANRKQELTFSQGYGTVAIDDAFDDDISDVAIDVLHVAKHVSTTPNKTFAAANLHHWRIVFRTMLPCLLFNI